MHKIGEIYLQKRAEQIFEAMREDEYAPRVAEMCCDYNQIYKFLEHYHEMPKMLAESTVK